MSPPEITPEMEAWLAEKLAAGEVPQEVLDAAAAVVAACDRALAALADEDNE